MMRSAKCVALVVSALLALTSVTFAQRTPDPNSTHGSPTNGQSVGNQSGGAGAQTTGSDSATGGGNESGTGSGAASSGPSGGGSSGSGR